MQTIPAQVEQCSHILPSVLAEDIHFFQLQEALYITVLHATKLTILKWILITLEQNMNFIVGKAL